MICYYIVACSSMLANVRFCTQLQILADSGVSVGIKDQSLEVCDKVNILNYMLEIQLTFSDHVTLCTHRVAEQLGTTFKNPAKL